MIATNIAFSRPALYPIHIRLFIAVVIIGLQKPDFFDENSRVYFDFLLKKPHYERF
jgi:hypothetical protein